MQKFRNADIRPFEFSDLKGTHVVTQQKLESFSFQTLDGEVFKAEKVSEESLRDERRFEKKNDFKIDEVVRNYRGLSRQEQSDLEKQIQDEVQKRLEAAYQEAYQEGLEKGKEEGKESAFNEYQQILDQRVREFSDTIASMQDQTQYLLQQNQKEIYEFIKRFTKWILLKEIDEKVYLETLLEKLILELNARKNIIIKVGRDNFSQMPEVIQKVEARIGQLSNVRIEIVPEIQHPGIILEAENGLIDGSLEGVFQNIDKIFQQVVGNEQS
jgi:flagellar assembly protein FliH